MESRPPTSPAAARATLAELDSVRGRIADRVPAPWWYRTGVAASTACLFLGMGLIVGRPDPGSCAETGSVLLIAVGACVAPSALLWALQRSTGVSVDRYSQGLAAWCVVMVLLLVIGFVVQAFLEMPFALPAAGAVAFVATLVNERRIDVSLRERVRVGG